MERIGGEWQQATVAWVDAEKDVAVLSCPGLRADGMVRWGRLVGSQPLEWGAVGFPVASVDNDAGRQPEHAFGRVSSISDLGAGRLALTIESREAIGRDSPWAGLSGAAVFCGDYLVGVVTTDPGSYARSLVGRRVADFCHDPAFAQLLGGLPMLEDFAGGVRASGQSGLEHVERGKEQRAPDSRDRWRAISAFWPMPRVRDADLYSLGVFYSSRAEKYSTGRSRPPYVPRTIDEKLTHILRSKAMALVKGQSRAGKSRTAFEIALQELGDWKLLVPRNHGSLTAIAELYATGDRSEPTLIWLDDLDVSNRGTRGRSCCGVGLGMAELPSAACGAEGWAGFAGLRIAGVTGRGRDRWRDDGGRVLGVSRAGRGPGRLRPGHFRHCGRIRAGRRSAG